MLIDVQISSVCWFSWKKAMLKYFEKKQLNGAEDIFLSQIY